MPTIHPTALVAPQAQLADDVEIGAFAWIGPDVTLGPGTRILHHATVDGSTTLGAGNLVHPYAYIGGPTQDLKFQGGQPRLVIGDHNVFREFVTVHTATAADGMTSIGSANHFLAYVHIAHDCTVGNHVIMSNNATLAGHVTVEDRAVIGGLTAIHQFCRIGQFAMLGGCAKVVQDVPPFMIADGNPAEVRSINKVGMERGGFTAEQVSNARKCFKIIYRQGLNHKQAMDALAPLCSETTHIPQVLIDFMRKSQRGLT